MKGDAKVENVGEYGFSASIAPYVQITEGDPLYKEETIREILTDVMHEMQEATDAVGAHIYSEEQDDAIAEFNGKVERRLNSVGNNEDVEKKDAEGDTE
jgi:hypothetical protein